MIQETLVSGIIQHAQPRGGGMMGEIKLGGVLDRQHHGLTGHPGFIGLPVGCGNFTFVDLVIVKKPIRGLEPSGVPQAGGMEAPGLPANLALILIRRLVRRGSPKSAPPNSCSTQVAP
jgi:hypothetical protein